MSFNTQKGRERERVRSTVSVLFSLFIAVSFVENANTSSRGDDNSRDSGPRFEVGRGRRIRGLLKAESSPSLPRPSPLFLPGPAIRRQIARDIMNARSRRLTYGARRGLTAVLAEDVV